MAQPDYERTAAEVIAALRGRRSCAGLSRLAGYRSNIAQRWETGHCFPPTSVFLRLHRKLKPRRPTWLENFFHAQPDWAVSLDPTSSAAVAAFLRHMKGKTPTLRWAQLTGYNRYGIGRWLAGQAEPRLPDFLHLADVSSRRMPDLVAAFVDPLEVPSVRDRWARVEQARAAGYAEPWSHAVLRALEIQGGPRGKRAQARFVAGRLGIPPAKVEQVLELLEATDQIVPTRAGYRPAEVTTIDTGSDPQRARAIKEAWLQTALERLRDGRGGRFGYSLFAVSEHDLERLHALHLSYVRAMQELIASSAPAERVGLYCAQLLDLGDGYGD